MPIPKEARLFPTKGRKSKISRKLSYPIGAQLISSELSDVPQAQELSVSFRAKYERMAERGEPYEIVTVSYQGNAGFDEGWHIKVRPVPRALKHQIQEALVTDFLPSIRQWLNKHADLGNPHEYRSLAVVFDETDETPLALKERAPFTR